MVVNIKSTASFKGKVQKAQPSLPIGAEGFIASKMLFPFGQSVDNPKQEVPMGSHPAFGLKLVAIGLNASHSCECWASKATDENY